MGVIGYWQILMSQAQPARNKTRYAIALSNIGAGASGQDPDDAIGDLDDEIAGSQEGNFNGTSADYTESIGLDNDMISQDLQDFVDMAKLVADNSLMASDVPGPITGSTSGSDNEITIGSQTIELGSVDNPKITYFNMKPDDIWRNRSRGRLPERYYWEWYPDHRRE